MTPSPDLESLAQEVGDKVHADFKFGDGSAVEPIILSALQSAVAYERERTLEACAALAENWPCNCHLHYPPPGKHQHHGHDCETEVGRDIAESMRALKSNKDLTNPTV